MARGNSVDAVVDFAVKWEPFGGPPAAEVFVEFGMDIGQYKRRLFSLLSKPDRAGSIDPALRGRLIAYSLNAPRAEYRPGQ